MSEKATLKGGAPKREGRFIKGGGTLFMDGPRFKEAADNEFVSVAIELNDYPAPGVEAWAMAHPCACTSRSHGSKLLRCSGAS